MLESLSVRIASLADLERYLAFSRAAQARIQQRGLAQYVPAAHDAYRDSMRRRIEHATLHAVECMVAEGDSAKQALSEPITANGSESSSDSHREVVAYFNLESTRSSWWADGVSPAAYLAGMVVGPEWRRHGIGRWIVQWCLRWADERNLTALRLDCHAGNAWLRQYYESQGFELRGYVAMHPGYDGCLYERAVGGRLRE